jgi:EamA domain-containing membrane protein RarD
VTSASFLYFAAAVVLIVVGVLLLTETLDVRDGLALTDFALAAFAVAASPWRP